VCFVDWFTICRFENMRHLAVGGVLVTLPPIFFALNLTQGKPNATFCAMRWITDNLEALTRQITNIHYVLMTVSLFGSMEYRERFTHSTKPHRSACWFGTMHKIASYLSQSNNKRKKNSTLHALFFLKTSAGRSIFKLARTAKLFCLSVKGWFSSRQTTDGH